jgi:hypothetical protein
MILSGAVTAGKISVTNALAELIPITRKYYVKTVYQPAHSVEKSWVRQKSSPPVMVNKSAEDVPGTVNAAEKSARLIHSCVVLYAGNRYVTIILTSVLPVGILSAGNIRQIVFSAKQDTAKNADPLTGKVCATCVTI